MLLVVYWSEEITVSAEMIDPERRELRIEMGDRYYVLHAAEARNLTERLRLVIAVWDRQSRP